MTRGSAMGWFWPDKPIVWDAVVAGGTIYPAFTDKRGVAYLDVDEDIEVIIDGVLIGDEIWPAYADEDGRVWVIEDDGDEDEYEEYEEYEVYDD
jgi:hypothetical protein